jgi:protease IV
MRCLLPVACAVSVMFCLLTPAGAATPAAKHSVVVLTLSGSYPEESNDLGLLGDGESTLASAIERIDAAAADKEVVAVWLKIGDLSVGRAKIFELRNAIARLRKAKKPVFAELSGAGTSEYLVAAACDRVAMTPSGVLAVPGVRLEITFYKGLLDKLGLQFDGLRMGKYKGAIEPWTRAEMSKPLRKAYETIADDLYQELTEAVMAGRRLNDYQVKTYLDRGMFSAEDAKKAGLIDDVFYSDQVQEAIKQTVRAEKVDFNTHYKQKNINADFSGISGMVRLVELFSGAKPSAAAGKKPRIAVVYAVGSILQGKSTPSLLSQSVLGSTTLIEALGKAAADPKVVAIVLRIDSHGGSVIASDLIWHKTKRIRQPIIVSMGDVAGSGGYYIALAGKKIFAAPSTMTGSIGVLSGKLVTGGLYDRLGLHTEVIARGANSSLGSSQRPFTPEERKVRTEHLETAYRDFVRKVAESRKMTFDQAQELAQGRVYTGRTAKKLGLVDALGTLHDAIAEAKTAGGLKADADVDLLVLPEPKTLFEQFFGGAGAAAAPLASLLPEGTNLLHQAETLRRMLSQGVLAWMPYTVEVK